MENTVVSDFSKLDRTATVDITEEKLFRMLMEYIMDNDIDYLGKPANKLINKINKDIETIECLDEKKSRELAENITDIGVEAADYALRFGFQEGIRLMRNLMQL